MARLHKWSIVGLAVLGMQACTGKSSPASDATSNAAANTDARTVPSIPSGSTDPADATYSIDGETVVLNRGVGQLSQAAGKALGADRIRVVSGPLYKDLDNDGDEDAIVLMSLEAAGRPSRYYLGAAQQTHGRFSGSNSLFLGGDIGQPTILFSNGLVSASYYWSGASAGSLRGPRTVQARWNGRRFELL
ncbi:hypothetical protein [Lysobacter antibioticus]|uniref:hypothetical protein n=1 Tax=Lysobacter antibioticus TaxID=84531 RepID=UPI0011877066|nr:hypothetical protein [Lysobacter antibioticus]